MPPTAKSIYPSQNPHYARFPSRRSVVHGTRGVVSCSNPLAARAGIRVLEQGGNAADAAVAVAAALNVTEPGFTGIGGDLFCLFYDAKTKKTQALNGSGRSPAKPTLDDLRKNLGIREGDSGEIPFKSVEAVTVPGAAAGWVDTVEKFGGGRVPLQQILTPAIELAEQGYPVSMISSNMFRKEEREIRHASPNFAEMLKPDPSAKDGCRAPMPGELMWNRNLANTFRLLARHGRKGFYEGPVADAYVKVVQDLGGSITHDDLKHHGNFGSEEVDAMSLEFKGQGIEEPVKLWEHPPNGSGLIALMTLGIFQELEKMQKVRQFSPEDHNSAEYLHALVESLRLAYTDGTWFISDPNTDEVPISSLLSTSYLSERASLFSPATTTQSIQRGRPVKTGSDTVYLSVTDPQGNAASFINSNYAGFGTAIVPRGCGFTLQNRGANFELQPADHPNVYAPRKRPYHTIIPAMVTNAIDGSLHTCYGCMGGFMQPQGQVQILLNMLVFGMNPQEAVDAPRICVEMPVMTGESKKEGDEVYIEEGIPRGTVEGLEKLGHRCIERKGFARDKFGRSQVIRRHEENGQTVWSAGSDPRGDGMAIPL